MGSTKCPGERIPTTELDAIVLDHLARAVCAPERCDALVRSVAADRMELPHAWSTLVTAGGTVSRNYLLHVIERIEGREHQITIIPRPEFASVGGIPDGETIGGSASRGVAA